MNEEEQRIKSLKEVKRGLETPWPTLKRKNKHELSSLFANFLKKWENYLM